MTDFYSFENGEHEPAHPFHHLIYQDELRAVVIKYIERLCKVEYIPPYEAFELPVEDCLWVGGGLTIPYFLGAVARSGRKGEVLQYLTEEISEWTLQLGDDLVPVQEEPTLENSIGHSFWAIPSIYQPGEYAYSHWVKLQLKEIDRFHRKWLINLKRELLVEPEKSRKGLFAKNPTQQTHRYRFVPEEQGHSYEFFRYQFEDEEVESYDLIVEGGYAKVYNPQLATLLCGEGLKVYNVTTKSEENFPQAYFCKVYSQAFRKGVEQFQEDFKWDAGILSSPYVEKYVQSLLYNYQEAKHPGLNGGWVIVKPMWQKVFTKQHLETFGYYAGMVSQAEKIMRNYPAFFADYSGTTVNVEATHREVLIAHEYKCKARLAKALTRPELLQVGPKRYQASLTLNPKTKSYKAPSVKELEAAIELLKESQQFSPALRMAINDLDKLQNS